jgi:hypothetical protein
LDRSPGRPTPLPRLIRETPPVRVAPDFTEMCVNRGWCLGAAGNDLVRDVLHEGVDAVVDALICEELRLPDPALCDSATRRWLLDRADDWLVAPCGRGANSGLPL